MSQPHDLFATLPGELLAQIVKEFISIARHDEEKWNNGKEEREKESERRMREKRTGARTTHTSEEWREELQEMERIQREGQWFDDGLYRAPWLEVFNKHKAYRYAFMSVARASKCLSPFILPYLFSTVAISFEQGEYITVHHVIKLCQNASKWLSYASEAHIVFHPFSFWGHTPLTVDDLAIVFHCIPNAKCLSINDAPISPRYADKGGNVPSGLPPVLPTDYVPLELEALTVRDLVCPTYHTAHYMWGFFQLFKKVEVLDLRTRWQPTDDCYALEDSVRRHIDELGIKEITYQRDVRDFSGLKWLPFPSECKALRLRKVYPQQWPVLLPLIEQYEATLQQCHLDFSMFYGEPCEPLLSHSSHIF